MCVFLLICCGIGVRSATSKETVMVTAATSEFGNSIASVLAREGYDLILCARNQRKLEVLKNRLEALHAKSSIHTCYINFADVDTIRKAVVDLGQRRINGVVLIGPRPRLCNDRIPAAEEWSQAFAEAFIGPVEMVRNIASNIQNHGSIVMISGNSSKRYAPEYANVNVIRWALAGEINNLVHQFAERSIRVNAVSPGPILTQARKNQLMETSFKEHLTDAEKKGVLAKQNVCSRSSVAAPLGCGKLEDVSNLVSFLLSEKSSHVNGTNIALDGGESFLPQ